MTILQRIKAPTPKKWRKLGNALIAVGSISTAGAFVGNSPVLGYCLLGCTVVGKFLTALFVEDA